MDPGRNRRAVRPRGTLILPRHHVLREHVPATRWFSDSVDSNRCQITRLVSLQHLSLLQALHGVHLSSVLLLHQSHLVDGIDETISGDTGVRTSPKAPFPITLTVLKSASLIFVRLRRRCWDSVLLYLRISRSFASGVCSWLSRVSISMRLSCELRRGDTCHSQR